VILSEVIEVETDELKTEIRNAPVPFFIKPITRQIANRVDNSFLNRNFATNIAFLEDQLATSPGTGEWFCGSQLTGADIMMIFPMEAGQTRAGVTPEKNPKIVAWIKRVHEREAYKRAIKKIEDKTGEKFSTSL
jgi:glutathione S-transferase